MQVIVSLALIGLFLVALGITLERKAGARLSGRLLVAALISVLVSGAVLAAVGLLVTRKDADEASTSPVSRATPTSTRESRTPTPTPGPPAIPNTVDVAAVLATAEALGRLIPSATPTELPAVLTAWAEQGTVLPTQTPVPPTSTPIQYVFVEYWQTPKGTGDCPHELIDFPTYSGSADHLRGHTELSGYESILTTPMVGFLGKGENGLGGGAASELYAIETLPYLSRPVVIHSVDADGTIVAEMSGSVRELRSGESWEERKHYRQNPGCEVTVTYRLTNYGLLDESQVEVKVHLSPHADPQLPSVNQIAWTADGERLLVANERTIGVYEATSLDLVDYWLADDEVFGVIVSPDGRYTASGGNAIQFWDVLSGQPVGEPVSEPPGPWHSLAFSPDGALLASGSNGGVIQLWDTRTRSPVGEPWADYMHWIRNLSFSSDGRVLISSGGDRIIRLWDVETGEVVQKMLSRGNEDHIVALALSPNQVTLASGDSWETYGNQRCVFLWDVDQGRVVGSIGRDLYNPVSLAFSPDGRLLAGGTATGGVLLWDLQKSALVGAWSIGTLDDLVTSVVFSPDGSKLAAYRGRSYSARQSSPLWVLDLQTMKRVQP